MSQQQPQTNPRGRWVAIVTGVVSILIGVLYLGLITVLDARGPLQPPPPRPWAWRQLPVPPALQWFHHPAQGHLQKPAQRSLPPVEVVLALHHLLQTSVTPVLTLLEIGEEAEARNARQPGGTHPLHSFADHQRRQIQAQGRGDQPQPPLITPRPARVRPTERARSCPASRVRVTP